MFGEQLIAQLIGIIGLIILIYGLYQTDDNKSAKIVLISLLFWSTHFFLLGIYSAVAANIIGILRTGLSLKYKRSFGVFLFITFLIISFGYFSYQNIISTLPLLASFFGAYGYFYLSGKQKKKLMLFCSGLWLGHNILVLSIAGIYSEILIITTLLISIYNMSGHHIEYFHFKERLLNIFHFHHQEKPDLGRYNIVTENEIIK